MATARPILGVAAPAFYVMPSKARHLVWPFRLGDSRRLRPANDKRVSGPALPGSEDIEQVAWNPVWLR